MLVWSGTEILGSWVRNPLEAWIYAFCVVLSCVYVEALQRVILSSEESYQNV